MAIDWSATGDMLAGAGAVVGAGAVAWAAWLGRSALSDYRHQRLTDKEIDVADRAMTAAYRGEEAVEGIRGRWVPAGELNASEAQLKELGLNLDGMNESEKSAYIQRDVIYRRAEFFKSNFDAVFDVIPSARAYFGLEIVDALKAFPRARNRILSSSDLLPMISQGGAREETELYKSVRSDVFGIRIDNDEDPIGHMVSEALITLEERLLPVIRANPSNA